MYDSCEIFTRQLFRTIPNIWLKFCLHYVAWKVAIEEYHVSKECSHLGQMCKLYRWAEIYIWLFDIMEKIVLISLFIIWVYLMLYVFLTWGIEITHRFAACSNAASLSAPNDTATVIFWVLAWIQKNNNSSLLELGKRLNSSENYASFYIKIFKLPCLVSKQLHRDEMASIR